MFKKSVIILMIFCFIAHSSFLVAQELSQLSPQELKDKKKEIVKQLTEITNKNIQQGPNKKQSIPDQQNVVKLMEELTEIQVIENSIGKQ